VQLAGVTDTGTLLTAFAGHRAAPFGAPFSWYSTEAVRVFLSRSVPNGAILGVSPRDLLLAARVIPGGLPYWDAPWNPHSIQTFFSASRMEIYPCTISMMFPKETNICV
jgi:hypothetical protein